MNATSAPVVFIDTETLGLDPDHNPVWEVGIILPNGDDHEIQVEVGEGVRDAPR